MQHEATAVDQNSPAGSPLGVSFVHQRPLRLEHMQAEARTRHVRLFTRPWASNEINPSQIRRGVWVLGTIEIGIGPDL